MQASYEIKSSEIDDCFHSRASNQITVPMTTQVYAKTIVVSIWNNTPELSQRQTSDCDILGIQADLWSEIGPRKA